MADFEKAFNDTENSATSTLKAASAVTNLAKQMQKAAREGNIGGIKRATDRLTDSMNTLRQEIANAAATWPFDDDGEEEYLKNGYAEELRTAATAIGLDLYESDGRLISYPSIVRVLPGDKAVQVDRKKVSSIRPSLLANMLKDNQNKRPRFRPEAFLEAIYDAYRIIRGDQKSGRLIDDQQVSSVVPLMKIYEVFTSLPGSRREFDPTDFARALYFLDTGDVRQTNSGARITFPASTGTRSAKGTFSFVGPNGNIATYYGVQFSGGA